MELLLLAGILLCLISTTSSYDFYVGGRDGWVQKPSEGYSQWASRMRFQVHDNLVFRYKKGEDSVLVVKKEDYDSCNTSNPIEKMADGDSVFRFDRSGPFYFVSGAAGKCAEGQKLVIVVLAERTKSKPPPAPSAGPPTTSPYSPSPVYYSPTVSPTPSLIVPPSYEESPPSPAPSSYVKEQSSASAVVTVPNLSIGVLVLFFASAVMT